jgi:hypothetical protein
MLLAATVILALAGTVDLSNRTEVRARDAQGAVPNPSFDLVDIPTAHLALRERTWDTGLNYSALAILPDAQTQLLPQVVQFGDVGIHWHDRRVRLGLAEYVGYGEQNSAVLLAAPAAPATPATPGIPPPPTAPPSVQALASPSTIIFGNSRSVLTSQVLLSRLWSASTSLEYSLAGGLDAASRQTLPFLHGPSGDATLLYSLTRLDGLETRAAAQRSDSTVGLCSPVIQGIALGDTCNPTSETAQLSEAWRRRITRTANTSLGGGASFVHLRLRDGDPFTNRVYPVIQASFTSTFARPRLNEEARSSLRIDAQVAPLVDIRTGIIDERAQGVLAFKHPIGESTLSAALTGARSITSPFIRPVAALGGLIELEHRLDRYVSIGGGIRYAWQEQAGIGAFAGGMAFAQVTFRAPQGRF